MGVLVCHTSQYDRQSGDYSAAGVSCQSCHGPVSEDHPDKSTKLLPVTAQTCESCHSITTASGGSARTPEKHPLFRLSQDAPDAAPQGRSGPDVWHLPHRTAERLFPRHAPSQRRAVHHLSHAGGDGAGLKIKAPVRAATPSASAPRPAPTVTRKWCTAAATLPPWKARWSGSGNHAGSAAPAIGPATAGTRPVQLALRANAACCRDRGRGVLPRRGHRVRRAASPLPPENNQPAAVVSEALPD